MHDEEGEEMVKHYITKYEEDGKLYAESWIQINIFGKCYCISRKRTEITRERKRVIKKEIVKEVNAVTNINEVETKVVELSGLIKKANSQIEELAEIGLKVELEIK